MVGAEGGMIGRRHGAHPPVYGVWHAPT
jgi:hypothetical protein